MKRPPIEVADIIRAVGRSFIDKNQSWLNGLHLKVLSAIERCRTAALGGHRDRCLRCGYTAAISYNSLPQPPLPQVCLAQTSAFSASSTPGDRIFFTIAPSLRDSIWRSVARPPTLGSSALSLLPARQSSQP